MWIYVVLPSTCSSRRTDRLGKIVSPDGQISDDLFVEKFVRPVFISDDLSVWDDLSVHTICSSSSVKTAIDFVHYINNSRHLARKYARLFVRRHYLFLVAHSFPRASLSENCSLLGTDNVCRHFRPKWRLLPLLSFKSFSQRAQFWKLENI